MDKNQPLVSVIIPVYNVEKYLKECVDSVIRQTYQNYEIILVDDGATDSSGRMCDDYLSINSCVKVIHQENGGLSAARNTGLRASKGEYIYFLDSDDYIEDNTLEHLVELIEKENADAVFFDGYVFFDECEDDQSVSRYVRKERYKTQYGKEMLYNLLLNKEYRTAVPLMFYRKEYLVDNRLCFLDGILHEDELFTFLVFNANGVVAHCHEQLYARRIRPESIMTGSKMIKRYESLLRIYQEIEDAYKTGKAVGRAANIYMIRIAKSVWGKYQLLEEKDKSDLKPSYQSFCKNVLSYNGFGDSKLKIKCSDGLLRYMYRVEYKIKRIMKKES